MRYSIFCLLACAAISAACQPITPASMKAASPSPKLTINEAELLPAANPTTPVPAETLSPVNVVQNNGQTEIDLAISAITINSESQKNTQKDSSNITPQVVTAPKTFDPTKIIGFTTPVLIRDLGKANMVRKEGKIEVWQYQFASCVVDFFFYPVSEGNSQLIARDWDMRNSVISARLDRIGCRAEMNLYHRKILSKF